jgi:hypothetical protein
MMYKHAPHVAHPAIAHSPQGSLAKAVLEVADTRIAEHSRVWIDSFHDESAAHSIMDEYLLLAAVIHRWGQQPERCLHATGPPS